MLNVLEKKSPGVRTGWFTKRGEVGVQLYLDVAWKRRYFISDPDDATMKYFESESSTSLLGTIDYTKVKSIAEDGLVVKLVTFQNQKKREWLLRGDSKEEAHEWYLYMQATIDYLSDTSRVNMDSRGVKFYLSHIQKLNSFCENYCEGVSLAFMQIMLEHGFDCLYKIKEREMEFIAKIPDQNTIVAVAWALTVKVAEYDELFTGGVIRIDDEAGVLFNYLDSSQDVYPRSSSHYSERLEESLFKNPGPHRGLDIRFDKGKWKLPAAKHTILFFRLADSTTVMKLESAGCPPFWKGDFRTLDNAIEFKKHTADFLNYKSKSGKKSTSNKVKQSSDVTALPRRQEQTPKPCIDAFKKCLEILYPSEIDFDNIFEDNIREDTGVQERFIYKKLFRLGCIFGISTMLLILHYHSAEGRIEYVNLLEIREKNMTNDSESNVIEVINSFSSECEISLFKVMDSVLQSSVFDHSQDVVDAKFSSLIIHRQVLMEFVDRDKARGYRGERKGSEATLPALFRWPELKSYDVTSLVFEL